MPAESADVADAATQSKLRKRAISLREELERERDLFLKENAELQRMVLEKESVGGKSSGSSKVEHTRKSCWSQEWGLILLGLVCLGVIVFANTGAKQPPPSPEAGEAFLQHNAKSNTDIVVRPSGLQYRVLKEGYGRRPKSTSSVKVLYEGRLTNGQVFDSSDERGPTSFSLNKVVKGWTEGVPLMREGAQYEFFLPSRLGYGNKARGRWIYPNAVLIFKITLLSCESDCQY